MGEEVSQLYWDSCVFIRFITANPTDPILPHLRQHISDAKAGKTQIHFSTISFAEIKPSHFARATHNGIDDFFDDFSAAFYPIDPSPNILRRAGYLRDHRYHNPSAGPPSPKNNKDEYKRVVGTADAIHLMTCLHLRDDRDIKSIRFQTLDEGKGQHWEGRCVPLLTFEQWTQGITDTLVAKTARLPRERPTHPQPQLNLS